MTRLKVWRPEAIEDLKSRRGVDGKVVEGFLANMGASRKVAISKLWKEAGRWNAATVIAIRDGIDIVFEEEVRR